MADEKITGGIRNTTSDGGSTTADVTIQNGAFNAASIGIVRPTGDGQQWSVSAQVNAVNGVVDGGQVKFSLGATPTSGDPVVSTTQQQYQMPNGETRTLEMPRISNQYADPGVNRTAVGIEVTGAQQQVLSTSVAGFDINASAAPRVGVAYGQNANGNTAFGLDAGADIASNLGNRQVGVQLMDTSKDGLSIKPYEREPTSNANLDKTFNALYEPTRPVPPTPEQQAAALREDPAYKTALGSLQKQGYDMNPAPDSQTDRLAAAVAVEAKKNNLTNFDVAIGNTVVNSDGKADRNLFLVSNELPAGKNVYTSETNALNTPVADQAVKAQAQQAQTPQPQIANPQLETQTQEPKARSMQ